MLQRLTFVPFAAAFLLAVAMASSTLQAQAPTVVATKSDGTPAAAKKNPGDTVTYTNSISNTGTANATGVTFTDPDVNGAAVQAGTLKVSPVAIDDTYSGTIVSGVAIDTSVGTNFSVTANDYTGIYNGAAGVLTITAFDTVTAHGGVVSMTTSGANLGKFTYTSAAGYTGADSFTYTVSNTGFTSSATVNLTVSGPGMFFVSNATGDDTTGKGTLAAPYKTLTKVATVDATGARIFVFAGTYSAGMTLENNEQIFGQGVVGANFDAVVTGVTAGVDSAARPSINGTIPTITAASGNVINLADSNVIRGVTINSTVAGFAVSGSGVNSVQFGSSGGASASDTTINSSSASSGGVSLTTSGNGTVNILGLVSNSAGAGRSITISGRTGGTVSVVGKVTDTGSGVLLNSNAGATFNLRCLALATGSNTALNVTSSGTINITSGNSDGIDNDGDGVVDEVDEANIINNTTGGIGLNIVSTNIGVNNVTFRSITSTGGTSPGINLSGTGSSGGLIVTGDGGGSNNASGGSITNKTGSTMATGTPGVIANNTANLTLRYMNITGCNHSGIYGNAVNGFILSRCNINTNGNDLVSNPDETGVDITNLAGTGAAGANPTVISNCVIQNNKEFELQITNSSGTLTDFQLVNCTIASNNADTLNPHGNLFNFVGSGTATMTANVAGCSFTGNARTPGGTTATGAHCDISGTGSMTANISACTFTDNNVGVNVSAAGAANLTFDVHDNPSVTVNRSHGLNCFLASDATGQCNGKFRNNVVGVLGTAGSGSDIGFGIRLQVEAASSANTANFLISGNTVQETANFNSFNLNTGLATIATTKTVNCTITSNIFKNSNARAITIQQNNNTNATSAGTVHVSVGSNTFSGIVGQAADGTEIRFRHLAANGGVFRVAQTDVNNLASANGLTLADLSLAGTFNYNQGAPTQPPLLFAPGGIEKAPAVTTPVVARALPALVPSGQVQPHPTPSGLVSAAPQSAEIEQLTQAQLTSLVAEARQRWSAAGLEAEQEAILDGLTFEVANLDGLRLGEAAGRTVRVDADGGTYGWYVGANDEAFVSSSSATRLYTTPAGIPAGRLDLLTALLHEMGHTLGLEDSYLTADRDNLMYGFLTKGERRLPAMKQAAGVLPHEAGVPHFLSAPISIGTLPPGKSVTITYGVIVSNPATTTALSSQGTVSGSNFASVLTDDLVTGGDPLLPGASDPTVTLIDLPDVTVGVIPTSGLEDNGSVRTFTFTRQGATTAAMTVNFSLTGTADPATDYQMTANNGVLSYTTGASSGTITIAAGSSVASFNITPTADSVVEPDETIIVNVATGTSYDVGVPGLATSIVTNDDTAVSIDALPDSSLFEDQVLNFSYTFRRAGVITGTTTVNFSVGGTAVFNTDYTQSGAATFTSTTGTVVFNPGETTKTIIFDPVNDNAVEGNETIILTVTNGTAYTPTSPTSQTATIVDDDVNVAVTSVAPSSVAEDSGTGMVYTFTRNGGSTANALTVNFTVGGTATYNVVPASSDYTVSGAASFAPPAGTFTFAGGQATKTVTITPVADATGEPDETVILTLAANGIPAVTGGYSPAASPNDSGTAVIVNDDTTVSVAVSPSSVGESSGTPMVYTFTRTGSTAAALTSNFTVTGTASFAAADFSGGVSGGSTYNGPAGTGTIVFPIGQSTATFSATPLSDTLVEANETVVVTVATGSGYVPAAGPNNVATGTINDDDTDVSVAVSPAAVNEDGTPNLTYTFTRVGQTAGTLAVNIQVSGSGSFGGDYTVPSITGGNISAITGGLGTVTFSAGSTSIVMTVDPTADNVVEGNETAVFTVLSGTGYNVTGSPASGTITDDDSTVSVAVSPASVAEDGATNLTYTFTRTGGPTTSALTVNFTGSGSATFNTDYTQSGASTFNGSVGTVVIPGGSSTATVVVDPTADASPESDETVILSVAANASTPATTGGYAVAASPNDSATGTIMDDDTTVSVAVSPSSAGESSGTPMVYTFTRTGSTAAALTANFTVTGTASFSSSDYSGSVASGSYNGTLGTGSVIFAIGQATATFTATPVNDFLFEVNETIVVTVAAGTGYAPAAGPNNVATGTIVDNDAPTQVAANSGTTPQSATVNTAYANALAVTVKDASNNALTGVSVTFTAPASGASGAFSNSTNTITVVTNASGVASAPFTANTVAGLYSVSASAAGVATPASFALTNTAAAANSVTVSTGSPQSTTVGMAFGQSLQVAVKDTFNNPVSGVSVTFTAPASGASGTFSNSTNTISVTTNGSGIASAPFTAGGTAGNYSVSATVSGVGTPASFSLTNTVGAASSVTVSTGSPQSTTVGTAFGQSLQVAVKDSFNNPISGATVTFTAPASGASAALTGNPATTNASGIASVGATANLVAGSYSVTASVAGVATPASFSLTNTAGAPASVTVSAGSGQSATVATAFGQSLAALVRDVNSNPVSGVSVTFTAPGSGASATFAGNATTTATTNASGVASVSATANNFAGAYAVTAAVSGVGTPASFSLTNTPGAATHYTVTAPASATAGVAINFTVTALDVFNNTATGYAGTVRFTSTDGAATLPANSTLTNGTGTFSATLKTAGSRTITATDTVTGSINGTSGTVNVGAAAASRYVVTSPTSATAGTPFNFTVTAQDAFNNTAPNYAGTVHFTTTDAAATLPANSTLTNGVGTFSATLITGGNQTLTATDTVASSITGSSANVNVTAVANISVSITDSPDPVLAGNNLTYVVTVTNNGPSAASGAHVGFVIPSNLSYVSRSAAPSGWTYFSNNNPGDTSGIVTASKGSDMASGSTATFMLTFRVGPETPADTVISGTATAGADTFDPTPINMATATTTVATQADLVITKTDGVMTATPGGSITYTITATNNGPSDVSSATVADTLPASLTATWTAVGAGGGTATAAGSGNINDTVNLPVGGSVTYTVSATISAAATGSLSNTATVSSSVTDPTPGNNSATDTDTLTPRADLAITKTDGVTTATPGGSVTYTITASNTGPSEAPGAVVTDTLPASLTNVNWSAVGAGGGTATASGSGHINETINLPVGGSVTYTVTANISPAATGTLSNTAAVAAPAGVTDSTPENNSATDSDTLTPQSDLAITKTDGVTTVTPTGTVTYTITASNAGPSDAPGATVADTLPASLTNVSWMGVGAGGGTATAQGAGNINDTVNLPAGGSVTYTVTATVAPTASGTLSNTATVAVPGGVTDPALGNNTATDTDTISTVVSIAATDASADENTGDTGTWRITRNNTVGDLVVQLAIDASSTASTTDWTQAGATFSSLEAGSTGTVTIPDGAGFVEITLTPADDLPAEAAETVQLNLTSDAAYTVIPPINATVTIEANDFVVTNTNDSGEGSLRQAVFNANSIPGANFIQFAGDTFTDGTPDVITLTTGEMPLSDTVAIVGPGANRLTISGNHASRVFNSTSSADYGVTISGVTLTEGQSAGQGGAITSSRSLTLRDVAITGNTAAGAGGGVFISDGVLTMINCTVSGNSATGAGSNGGGIQTLTSNTSYLIDCTIAGNTAAGTGGGLDLDERDPGAGGDLRFINCTITDNGAGSGASGIDRHSIVQATLANTIVAANKNNTVNPDIAYLLSGGGNLIGSASTPNGIVGGVNGDQVGTVTAPIDPVLGPLADNGGPTLTIKPLTGSPALNAGQNAALPADSFDLDGDQDTTEALPMDQRGVGFTRVRGAQVDVGAIEGNDPPVLTLPASPIVVEATKPQGADVSFTITASDAEDGDLTSSVVATPVSGSTFGITGASTDTTVNVSVTDADGAITTGSFVVTVQDTIAPVIVPHDNLEVAATRVTGAEVTYSVVATDAVGVSSLTYDPPSGSNFPLGTTTVTATAQDAAGHVTMSTFTVTVVLDKPVNTPIAVTGGPVIGAGSPDGPPADALWAGIGSPAIDENGHIAFVSSWTSASGGKGTGLFTDETCIAVVGGAVPNVPGATFKSFSGPVINNGRVASIVALTGVAKATASGIYTETSMAQPNALPENGVSLPPSDGALIVRAGDVATSDGATFKSFKSVDLRGNTAGFAASLTVGSGAPKTTAASDLGLWITSPANGTKLQLREGQVIDGPAIPLPDGQLVPQWKIKTLTTFDSSPGSRGQGRGWFEMIGGVPTTHARVVFTDRKQAILRSSEVAGNPTVETLLAAGEVLSGGYLVTNGFGYPAVNASGQAAFIASTDSETGPRQGIEVFLDGQNYERIAVRAGVSPLPGATFLSLQDPVLSEDGAIAFPAKIKGGGIKGVLANTLWWQPAGGSLTLLARGGAPTLGAVPNDLPTGAQWSAFSSLAIGAARGPIFVGTLVVGKGGVTTANASGVWAMDHQGKLRTLFRANDPIVLDETHTKTLKSFNILTPTVGNTGVTRSHNGANEITWLATFTDKTQAIIVTTIP